jgi:hypothetical protein
MTVRIQGPAILLEGRCPAGDAENLLSALRDRPGNTVDISGAEKVHMAVMQILLALRPAVIGRPQSGVLSQDIFHNLISDGDSRAERT